MKKFFAGLIIGLLLSGGVVFAADALNVKPNPFPVLIDGAKANVTGYNINGSTYLKLRDFEKAGLGVDFHNNQILVATAGAELVTPTPTPVPLPADQKVIDLETAEFIGGTPNLTKDNIYVYQYQGVNYVMLAEVDSLANQYQKTIFSYFLPTKTCKLMICGTYPTINETYEFTFVTLGKFDTNLILYDAWINDIKPKL